MAALSYFLDADGSVFPVDASREGELRASGFAPASPEQVAEHVRGETYGGVGQGLKAGLEGTADALTLGGSTFLEKHLFGVDPEAIKAREELHPLAHGLGTAAGVIAPLLATGGGSALAEGAEGAATAARAATEGGGIASKLAEVSAPSLLSKAGKATSKAVEGLLPTAEGTLGKIGSKALSSAAGSAIEGAGYGLGQAVHESQLGDPNVTAESLLAEVGMSALLGGAFGGAAGGLSEAAGGALSKLSGRFHSGDVIDKLKEFAGERWLKAAGGIQSDIGKSTKAYGHEGLMDLARNGQELGIVGPFSGAKSVAAKAGKVVLQSGEEIRQMLDAADGAVEKGLAEAPNVEDVFGRIRKSILKPLQADPLEKPTAARIEDLIGEYEKKYQGSLLENGEREAPAVQMDWQELHDLESKIGAKSRLHGKVPDAAEQPYAAALDEMRMLISRYVDSGVIESGIDKSAWKAANKNYQTGWLFETYAEKGLNRAHGNNFISPMEVIAGLTGGIAHGLGGGLATGLATVAARRYGSGVMAHLATGLADKLAGSTAPEAIGALSALERNNASVLSRIGDAASGILKQTPAAIKTGVLATTPEILSRIERVNQLGNNPSGLADVISQHIEGLHEHAPDTGQAAANAYTRGVSYLQSQAPQIRQDGPLAKPSTPSKAELLDWQRKFEAVADPVAALTAGRLDQATVQAIQTVYPALWGQLQVKLTSELTDHKDQIPYQRRLTIGRVLGVDPDGSMSPGSINANQMALAQAAANAGAAKQHGGHTGMRTAKFTSSTRSLTPTQRVMK
jgi:hypothetical protein